MPHLGHVAILAVFGFFGLLCASALVFSALHFHLFGVSSQQDAATEIHYTLGSEAVLYIFMLGACLLFFPMIWGKSFFAGVQWNGAVALQKRHKLFIIASVCFALALINGLLFRDRKMHPSTRSFEPPERPGSSSPSESLSRLSLKSWSSAAFCFPPFAQPATGPTRLSSAASISP